MTLLFITQKLHGQDVFTVLWIRAFMRRGYTVKVICLEATDAMYDFEVLSLGKEKGASKFSQILTFWKLISHLQYDRVFIHMTPVWGAIGAPVWIMKKIPVYLWYTHYKMQFGLKMLGLYGKRFFCATPQSLPQFEGSPKKVVVGHGIDVDVWKKCDNVAADSRTLLVVHRLSRSKRLELILRAMTLLPDYSLDIYGIDAEADYAKEMKDLSSELKLNNRVIFHGTKPMNELADLYAQHRLILNMASQTIDKTMLEAMTCGCYPVTTKGNAQAIGLSHAPETDTPEAIAVFVQKYADKAPISGDDMYEVVAKNHSLDGLIAKMDGYMKEGK
ncbi:MAG: glycosyltransferase family 4 protein [Candidatus Peribacteraceae bacterium]|nr:glycosyltransferase family 4 protein [Candidatus Peribacteraceae bacterium]